MKKIVEKSMLGKAWVAVDDSFSDSGELIKKILAARGVNTNAEIEKFLNPSIKEYMPDPFVLADMDVAAQVIADAVQNHQKIAIYGDYDVDGITSTAVFVKYLRAIGVDVVWHLPTREGEGYGLNDAAVDEIIAGGAKLLITVDCGISGVDEVAHARMGCDERYLHRGRHEHNLHLRCG